MSKIPARRRAIMSTRGPEWHNILFFRSIHAPTRERYLRSADSSGCVKKKLRTRVRCSRCALEPLDEGKMDCRSARMHALRPNDRAFRENKATIAPA
jgi:hypothetical protein